MKSLFAFALLLAITFIGSLRLFRQFKNRSILNFFIHSGTFYLFFGFLVGQNGLMWISGEVFRHLEPLIQFALGWAGFMYGFQLEKRYLRCIPPAWFFTTFLLFLIPVCILGGGLFLFSIPTVYLFTGSSSLLFLIWASPAVLFSESSTSFVFWTSRHYHLRGRNFRLLGFVAAIDNIFPILFCALLLCGTKGSFSEMAFATHLLFQGAIGLTAGWGIHLMVRNVQDQFDISTILFGIVFCLSGTAYLFHFSALFITMIAGITFTNLTRRHSWFHKRLIGIEKPLYLMFMIILPLYKSDFSWSILLIALAVVTLKVFAKTTALFMAPLPEKKIRRKPLFSAFLLLPMGSIAPAALLEMRQFFSARWIMEISGIFLLSMVLAEIVASWGVAKYNTRMGK